MNTREKGNCVVDEESVSTKGSSNWQLVLKSMTRSTACLTLEVLFTMKGEVPQ
jgi:hypothetical protein